METKNPVCLIIPPSAFLLDERVFVNLGILKIASILELANYDLDVLDLSGIKNYKDALHKYLLSSNVTFFGITATTPQMPQITEIAESIDAFKPDSKIILGGPHVTLVHTAAKKELGNNIHGRACKELEKLEQTFDILVSGDGEKAIFEALTHNAPKIIDANMRSSPLFLSNSEFDKSPLPARHLIDLKSYHYSIEGAPATSIIGQLGCPFSCGFCGGRESPCLRIARNRTVQSIISEIKFIYDKYHYTGFMFYDDELNVSPHFLELLNGLTNLQEDYGISFHFRGFVKSELFDEVQANAMYNAGFRWILSGFESGSPRILKNINKRATIENNSSCIKIAHDYNLKVKALMSIGHPGESYETIQQSQQWLLSAGPDDLDVTIITPYPGTSYYDHAVQDPLKKDLWVYTVPQNGDRLYNYEIDYSNTSIYYKGDPDKGYNAFTYTDYLSSNDIIQLRSEVEKNVRTYLDLPFNYSRSALQFEHSMGQTGGLPEFIIHSSTNNEIERIVNLGNTL